MTRNPASRTMDTTLWTPGGDGLIRGFDPEGVLGYTSWQLSAGQYLDSLITPKIIHPRPDVERTANSRWSYAYPGILFQAPVVVLGGSYPGLVQITARSGSASVGNATIQTHRIYTGGRSWYGSQDWKDTHVFKWTPDAGDQGKTYSFTLRFTGQDLVTDEVTFTGTVDGGKFVFVQDGAAGGGDGSISSPFEDLTDLWTDASDTTNSGKFVYVRAGNYAAFTTSNLTTNFPLVYMGYPGDDYWIMDGTAKDYTLGTTGMDDFWWEGARINGTPGTAVAQCRFFEGTTSTSDLDRAMYWRNYFYNGQVGSSANDNNGWIISLRSGTNDHKYTAIIGNIFDAANSSSNGFEAFTFFSHTEGVAEHNIAKNYDGEYVMQLKDGVNTWSIRANDLWENNTTGGGISLTNQSDGTITNHTQEVVWNFIQDSGACVPINSQEDPGTDVSPILIGRNTMRRIGNTCTDIKSMATSNVEAFEVIKNVMVADNNPHIIRNESTPIDVTGSTDAEAATFLTNSTFDNAFQTSITDFITTDGALTGAGRTTYLQTYGAEIE